MLFIDRVVRTWILRLLDQLWFRLLTLLLILLDVVLVILDLCDVGNRGVSELFSLIILSFFMIEVTARIFSKCVYFPLIAQFEIKLSIIRICTGGYILKIF